MRICKTSRTYASDNLPQLLLRIAAATTSPVAAADNEAGADGAALGEVCDVTDGNTRKSSRRVREKSEFQKRLDAYMQRVAAEEEEKRRQHILRLHAEHEYNFERFVLLKKSYETGNQELTNMLLGSDVHDEAGLIELEKAKAFVSLSLADLRGALYSQYTGDASKVNGAMSLYQESAAHVFECKRSEVTGEQMARVGSFLRAQEQAREKRREEAHNGAYSLKEWPGMGFNGFTRRKQEELWSLYAPDGTVIRELLPHDCTVIHFAGVGEVITHKAAAPLQKHLKDAWATERWKYLTPLDSRPTVADIRRTQGSGAINQIISIVEKIVNQKVEATASSDADHDYQFRLPYVEPHDGGGDVDLDMVKFKEENEHRFRVSHDAAMNHNNILPAYRLRYNMSKMNFAAQFLQKCCIGWSIAFKPNAEIEDQ